jgi:signal transduction histidine kinase
LGRFLFREDFGHTQPAPPGGLGACSMNKTVMSAHDRHNMLRRSWIPALLCGGLVMFAHACFGGVEATRVLISGVWVDGVRVADPDAEIPLSAESKVQVALTCEPPRFDARYAHQVEGFGDWTPGSPVSTLRFPAPSPGVRRILFTSQSPTGAWAADTARLTVRVAKASGVPVGTFHGVLPVMWASIIAMAVGGAVTILLMRRPTQPAADLPDGAVLVMDATQQARNPRPRDRAPKGKSSEANVRVPSRAGRAGRDMTPEMKARLAELEEEQRRLRQRIRDLLVGTRRLKRLNGELQDKCAFLERSNHSLRELQKRKEEVLATLAHDIKNPAGAIQNLAEILQSYDLSAQEQQDMVADILVTSARIIKLSHEMTEVMVAEVQSLPLEMNLSSIREALDQVVKVNRIVAASKGISIVARIPDNLPKLEMDAPRIEEALDNLVSNAIKYSRRDSQVKIEVKATNSNVTVEVTDTGAGINQADLKEAFQFGRKLTNEPTAGENSSGLGLWIVRKIVEAHHGVVWVRTAQGKGSTFSVMLPTRQPESQAA